MRIFQQAPVDCDIQEISFKELEKQFSWDDRQIIAKWDPMRKDIPNVETSQENSIFRKLTEPVIEPFFEIVPDSSRNIQLLMSAIAMYSEYECNIRDINFTDTLIFQVIKDFIFSILLLLIINC